MRSAVAIALLGVVLSLGWALSQCIDSGRWCCTVCGALEERWTLSRWTLFARSCDDTEDADIASAPSAVTWKRFERWFATTIGALHEHDWIGIGCHWNLAHNTVGCFISYGQAYFRTLPTLPNPDTAVAMSRRVLRASPSERSQLLRPLGLLPTSDLFGSLERGRSMSRAEFDEAFVRWRDDHPEWR